MKKDWPNYLALRIEDEKEYQKIIHGYREITSTKELKKEFDEIIKSKEKILLVAELSNRLNGFLFGDVATGKIDFVFVSKKFRSRGIANSLITEFSAILKKKNAKTIVLEINSKNKKALDVFRKLGFRIYATRIKMERKI